jgi:hypothetical protein
MRRRDLLLGAASLLFVRHAFAQGVRRVRGEVTVNGQPAKQGMTVRPGDKIATGPGAQVVFAVDRDAMLVRENSSVELAKGVLRVISGAVLSVFAPKQPKQIRTPTSTIGIRGTAVYVEAQADRTYVCTCYGEAVLEPAGDPAARETVRTTHHEQPRYIYAKGAPKMVTPAPMLNHTDMELEILEALFGREPPFKGKTERRY